MQGKDLLEPSNLCLCGLALGNVLETALFDFSIANFEFLDFSCHCHWKLIDESDVLRDFEVGDASITKVPDFLFC